MTNPIRFTMTQNNIALVINNRLLQFQAGTPQYSQIAGCILREEWDKIPDLITVAGALAAYLAASGGRFGVTESGTVTYDGEPVPTSITQRITSMATAGEDIGPMLAFYERLSKNPSRRSVQQLFDFLGHMGIPIQPDGTFVAYKGVREDLLDQHSGTILNEPGRTITMPRNQISDDPDVPCHEGLHVGALTYARSFAARTVACRIDPEHVVCVPRDYSFQKMRVCQYTVVGHYIADSDEELLPSTVATVAPSDDTDDDEEWGGDAEYETGETEVVLATPEAPAPIALTSKPTAPRAASFNRMSPSKLMEQKMDDLRSYAAKHLKIVGVGHMPGGKTKLVSRIMRARRKRSRK